MDRKIYMIIAVSLMLGGCIISVYKHGDSMLNLVLHGTVYDKITRTPLANVGVEFIDTGLDQDLSKRQTPFTIGVSNDTGLIDIKMSYPWGWIYGPFQGLPAKTFEIHLFKESYENQRFYFDLNECTEEKGTVYLDLGEIYLERSHAKQ